MLHVRIASPPGLTESLLQALTIILVGAATLRAQRWIWHGPV